MSVINPWTRDTMINHRSDFDLWSSVTAKPIKLILLIVAIVVVVVQLYCEYCPRIIYYSQYSRLLSCPVPSIWSSKSVACKQSVCFQLDHVWRTIIAIKSTMCQSITINYTHSHRTGQDTLMELIFSNKSSKCGPNVIIFRWRAKCASITTTRRRKRRRQFSLSASTKRHWMDPEKQFAIDLILSILIYVDHVYSSQSVSQITATFS